MNYVSYSVRDGVIFAECDDGLHVALSERFPMSEWDCPEAFSFAGVKGYAPMLALEISDDEQDRYFNDSSVVIEEKLDGTRALVHFFGSKGVDGADSGYCRVFSRRISEKTKFFVENSDLLPHIRDLDFPEFAGTIIDGELRIDGRPFRDVSSTLNCKWDKAVSRQCDIGFIVLHAFDILRYKGVDVRRCPLVYRKFLLHKVLTDSHGTPRFRHIKEHPWYYCGEFMRQFGNGVGSWCCTDYENVPSVLESLDRAKYPEAYNGLTQDLMSPRGYYEYIVSSGGEGVILKPSDGKYKCGKRQRDYLKVKKFLTRECIIMGFTLPTREYKGKFVNNRWDYWVDPNSNPEESILDIETYKYLPADELMRRGFVPVTRFYYYGLVGNIRYGVVVTDLDIASLPKNKKFHTEDVPGIGRVLEVGDCAGFSDEMKRTFSFSRTVTEYRTVGKHFPHTYNVGDVVEIAPWERDSNKWLWENSEPYNWIGSVVEIKANEMFSDTGKMRHPRFLRLRPDKSPRECTWKSHIG